MRLCDECGRGMIWAVRCPCTPLPGCVRWIELGSPDLVIELGDMEAEDKARRCLRRLGIRTATVWEGKTVGSPDKYESGAYFSAEDWT